ncbi:2-hydroxyacyl-CoA dehydratase subunit D [Chloroflexota bacterium]
MASTTEQVEKATRKTQAANDANTLIKNYYQLGKEIRERGGKVAWCMRGVPDAILFSMDILPVYPENYATVCAAKQVAGPFIDLAEEDGYSIDLCAYIRIGFGYAHLMRDAGKEPDDAPYGGMAKPDMLISPSRLCDPRVKFFEAMRRYLDIPAFMYDMHMPHIDGTDCLDEVKAERYIEYNTEQVRSLVDFLERQTGKKLDWDRLDEAVKNTMEVWRLYDACHELRRTVPSPMPSEDAFAVMFPYMWVSGEKSSVEFYQRLYDELKHNVETGKGIVPDEKFRILWIGIPPYFDMGVFNYLESLGVVSVMETSYLPGKYRPTDLSNPLKALMEQYYWAYDMAGSDGSEIRCGFLGGSRVFEIIQDYKIDGVLVHSNRSCRATSVGSKYMTNLLKERLNLPTLYTEADMCDARGYSPTRTRQMIDAFVEEMVARKK